MRLTGYHKEHYSLTKYGVVVLTFGAQQSDEAVFSICFSSLESNYNMHLGRWRLWCSKKLWVPTLRGPMLLLFLQALLCFLVYYAWLICWVRDLLGDPLPSFDASLVALRQVCRWTRRSIFIYT